jgi:hypothetical protein
MATTADVPDSRVWQSKRFKRWLEQRMPPVNAITLHQKNIFILPTRESLLFAVLTLIMVMAGINYEDSMVYDLAILLASLFMVSILHAYSNLAGLTLLAGPSRPAFAGEDAEFMVILNRLGARTCEALLLGWDIEMLQGVDLIEDEELRLRLFMNSSKRGVMNPGRMLIETFYPVGLFRA